LGAQMAPDPDLINPWLICIMCRVVVFVWHSAAPQLWPRFLYQSAQHGGSSHMPPCPV